MSDNTTFRIGITMAGAVSAGAYTGGFMDYFLETLQSWENKKEFNRKVGSDSLEYDKKVPMHDVIIDVLGGASAGGITSMMTILEMMKGHQPVHQPSSSKTGNIFYDTWVLLDDHSEKNGAVKIMEKMLGNSDIHNSKEGIPSLLNSSFIDKVASDVFDKNLELFDINNLPAFISNDMYLLVTLCSVRGIPFEIEFDVREFSTMNDIPAHRMNEHMIIARFKLKNTIEDKDFSFPFNLEDKESREFLKLCAKATSAFPIGLAPRQFKGKFSKEYIINNIKANMGEIDATNLKVILKDIVFDFTGVDGGTINNEPYTQVLRQLKLKAGEFNKKYPNYGVIMIDPFPNFYDQTQINEIDKDLRTVDKNKIEQNKKKSIFQLNLFEVLANAYPMFQEQTRIKREPDFFGDDFKMLVYPSKRKSKKGGERGQSIPRPHPPIASAVLGGFGGFLDKKFRDHDYFLGRDNARNFLRGVFMLRHDKMDVHPLFNDLSKEAFETFKNIPFKNNPKKNVLFPIIPDFTNPKYTNEGSSNPFKYTIEQFPKLSRQDLEFYQPKLNERIKLILEIKTKEWFKNSWVIRKGILLFKGKISKNLSNKLIDKIEKELVKHRLYKS